MVVIRSQQAVRTQQLQMQVAASPITLGNTHQTAMCHIAATTVIRTLNHAQSTFQLCKLWLLKHLTERSRLISRSLCEQFIDMVTAKLFSCFIEYYAMEQCEGVQVQHHIFLTPALYGGKWTALCPGCFTTRERASSTYQIEGWVVRIRIALCSVLKQAWKILGNKCFTILFCALQNLRVRRNSIFVHNNMTIGLFLQPTLMHNSIKTCMSHYHPQHVSGLDMPILRRNNCTNTASHRTKNGSNQISHNPNALPFP